MSLKEIDILGVYVAPIALDMAIAGALFGALRLVTYRIDIGRFVWHRPLFEVALFVILLALVELNF